MNPPSLFPPNTVLQPTAVPSPAMSQRSAVMQALARLKRFRAGEIAYPDAEISRDIDVVFRFVEQVTA